MDVGSVSPMKELIGKLGKVNATPGSSRLTWLFMMYLLALIGIKYFKSTKAYVSSKLSGSTMPFLPTLGRLRTRARCVGYSASSVSSTSRVWYELSSMMLAVHRVVVGSSSSWAMTRCLESIIAVSRSSS